MKEVQSIGISGGKTPLPKAGEGDIDAFIYCDIISEFKKMKEELGIDINKLHILLIWNHNYR